MYDYVCHLSFQSRWVSECGPGIQMQCRRHKFYPWVGKIPWRRKWQSTPVFLSGKSQGQRSLMGYMGSQSQIQLSDWARAWAGFRRPSESFKVSTLLCSTIHIEEKCFHITNLYHTYLEYFAYNRCGLGHSLFVFKPSDNTVAGGQPFPFLELCQD